MGQGDKTETQSTTPAPNVLDYGPPLPLMQRRRTRRVIQISVLLLLIVSLAWSGPKIWRRVQIWRLERACANYQPPAGRVACEYDAEKAKLLLAADPQYSRTYNGDRFMSQVVASLRPEPLRQLSAAIDTPNPAFGTPFWEWPPALFVGELRSSTGVKRIVVVHFEGCVTYTGKEGSWLLFNTVVLAPESFGGMLKPRTLDQHIANDGMQFDRNVQFTRFFFGRVNPADPSCVRIDYETTTNKGTIVGRLSEDGRWVSIDGSVKPY